MNAILEVERLCMHFKLGKNTLLKALDGVSFNIQQGECLGLVGESGCGKSTIGRCIMRLYQPTSGTIKLQGQDITHLSKAKLRPLRKHAQIIFQDPAEALDPRMNIGHIISEPLRIHALAKGDDLNNKVRELLNMVGLAQSSFTKYPYELSGGQKQRVGIARALALSPKLLILDEPLSALDASIQSHIVNLLLELQRELQLSYLFISHDISLVKHISDRIAVMYLGKIVELAGSQEISQAPRHAYTQALFKAVPQADPHSPHPAKGLGGEPPSPINPPSCSAFGQRIQHPKLHLTHGMDLEPREITPGHWLSPDPCAISEEDLNTLGFSITK